MPTFDTPSPIQIRIDVSGGSIRIWMGEGVSNVGMAVVLRDRRGGGYRTQPE